MWRDYFKIGIVFGTSSALALGIITVLFYDLSTFRTFFSSHFSKGTRDTAALILTQWNPLSLFEDSGPILAGLVSFAFLPWSKKRLLRTPAVLFITVVAFHRINRPYWYYYYLHFTLPITWIASIGLVEWGRAIWTQQLRKTPGVVGLFVTSLLCWSFCCSIVFLSLPQKLTVGIDRLASVQSAAQNRYVQALTASAAPGSWIFTDQRLAAFWAKLPVPPRLAIIPLKRIWSSSITRDEVMGCMTEYRPKLVMIPREWEVQFHLSAYLRSNYQLAIEPKTGAFVFLRSDLSNSDKHQ